MSKTKNVPERTIRETESRTVDEEVGLDIMEDEDAVDSFVDTQIKKGIAATGASEKGKMQKPPSKAQVNPALSVLRASSFGVTGRRRGGDRVAEC